MAFELRFLSLMESMAEEQNPVSLRLIARDIAEMMKHPYPNTRLVPFHNSLHRLCLLLNTGTRVIHVYMVLPYEYPKNRPFWGITGQRGDDEGRCAFALMLQPEGTQSYTLKTFAMHLLSMFDGDFELKTGLDGAKEVWLPSEWNFEVLKNYQCDNCGWHSRVDGSFVDQGADEHSHPKTTVTRGRTRSMNLILDIPVELLTRVLDFLGVQDILRLGQAFEEVMDVIEDGAIIRDRELRCFVTKEHFTDSSLGIGICLPPLNQQAGICMGSEFDLISSDAFLELGIRKTAYGCEFSHWLPLPLSEAHWDRVKDEAYRSLRQLSHDIPYEGLVDGMDVLTAFMEDQVIKLFASETPWDELDEIGRLRVSEKGIESLFFLFHLLLCVAVDNPEYVEKANKMIRHFQADDARLKDMPSPGRLLAALLISDVETDAKFLRKLFYEAVTRHVPQLLAVHPELEYMEYATSPYRLHHTFATDDARYRGIMFLDLFERAVRSADLGKPQPQQDGSPITFADILKAKRDFFFHRHGFPPSSVLADLAAELPRIMAVDSFPGLIKYMGLYSASRVDEYLLAGKLRDTVRECLSRGACMPWSLSPEEGAAQRLAAEEESPLPETEYLRPFDGFSSELDHEFKELLARNRM